MMRDLSKNLDYRQNYKTCLFLISSIAILLIIDIFASYITNGITFKRVLLTLLSFALFWPSYYYYFKELLYTFWGMSLFPFFYIFLNTLSVLGSNDYEMQSIVLLMVLGLFSSLLYLASSPLYYPRISWWEFDYRYRSDIKANIKKDDNKEASEIRLTDVRRKAGSLSSFDFLDLGEVINMTFLFKEKPYDFKCIIGSRSRRIIGRPFSYGFRFLLLSNYDKKSYRSLSLNWLIKERVKIDDKFKKENMI